MRIGVVCDLENGLSQNAYNDLINIHNLQLKTVEIDLIVIAHDNHLIELPCDFVFVYNQIKGDHVTEKYCEAIGDYYKTYKPSLVVVACKDADSIIPNTVVRLHSNLSGLLECDGIDYDETSKQLSVLKMSYGGNAMAHYNIKSGLISFKTTAKPSVILPTKVPKIIHRDHRCTCTQDFKSEIEYTLEEKLSDAEVVIVVGRGVGSQTGVESIKTWANSIGAAVGGTKKVIDQGWLSMHQLIGQTGMTIAPKICLVIGASGASPFINGIIDSKKIIAINSDRNARIFDYADIGIVEDYQIILKELKKMIDMEIVHEKN